MAVVNYYEMPDQATQDLIRQRGDTIQVIQRPSGPTASAVPQYGGMQASTFQGDPNLFGVPTHDSGVAQAMQASIQGGIEDQMYRQAVERYDRAMADYQWNAQANPAAIQSGLIRPPDFQQTLAQVRGSGGWNDTYERDFSQEQERYGTPAPYQPPAAPQAQNPNNNVRRESALLSSGDVTATPSATNSASPTLNFGNTSGTVQPRGENTGGPSERGGGRGTPTTEVPSTNPGTTIIPPTSSGYGGGAIRFGGSQIPGIGGNQSPTEFNNPPSGGTTPPSGGTTPGSSTPTYPNYTFPGYTPGGQTPPYGSGNTGTNPLGGYTSNQNPYQNLQYRIDGGSDDTPPRPRYGTQDMVNTPYTGDAINLMAQNDRNLAIWHADTLEGSLGDYTNYQYGRAANYEDLANASYGGIAQGNGGYTQQERDAILRPDDLNALRFSQAYADSNYLTSDETAGIMGNTGEVGNRVREGGAALDQILQDRSSIMRGNLGNQDTSMRNYLGQDLNYDSDVRYHSLDASLAAANNMRSATNRADLTMGAGFAGQVNNINSTGASNLRGAVDAGQMRLSDAYRAQQYTDLTDAANRIRSYDPNSIRTANGFTDSLTGMADQGAAATRAAYNPAELRQSSGYVGQLNNALANGTNNLNAAVNNPNLLLDPNFRGQMESALSGGEAAVRAGIDPERLRQDPAYRAQVEGALGTTEGNVRGALGRDNLTVSNEFNDRYNWTDRDSQDLVDRAGRTVQNQTQSQQDQLRRAAFAQGNTSPLAMAAAMDRAQLTGGVNSADAMTDARIAAKQSELETTRTRESMRLGAEQTYADMLTANEQALGGRRVAALSDAEQQRVAAEQGYSGLTTSNEQALAGRRVAALADTEQLRQNAEGRATDFRVQAADSDANRYVNALSQAEQMRMSGEQYGAGLATSIEQDAANRRLQAATQGENLRQSGAQAAVQAGTAQESDIGNRNVAARNTAESMRLNAENNLSNLRSNNEQYIYGQGLNSAFNTEGMRLDSAQSYAQLANSMESNIADRQISTLRNAENDRLAAAQTRSQLGLGAEQYLGSSRLSQEQSYADAAQQNQQYMTNHSVNTQQWMDEQNSQRASQVAQNRQATNQYNWQQQYGSGMDIYNANRSANTEIANARRTDEQEYRGYVAGQQNQANQNVTVGQQQRLNLYGTQMGAQQGATRNAITNYQTPGLWSQILGGLADGGVVKGAGPKVVGEEGPELVIDLTKSGDRYERMGSGGILSRAAGVLGEFGGQEQPQPGGYDPMAADNGTPNDDLAPGAANKNANNPLYQQILREILENQGGYSAGAGVPQQQGKTGSGAIGSAIGLAKLIGGFAAKGGVYGAQCMGDGGVAQPYSGSERYEIAPGVQYVNGPQLMQLGDKPQAVLPLSKRPDAKVRPEMLPSLHQRYGA